ncbi:MAG: hypothetical protein ACJ8FV_24125, partial [Xanthobacteraceae bacterium]
ARAGKVAASATMRVSIVLSEKAFGNIAAPIILYRAYVIEHTSRVIARAFTEPVGVAFIQVLPSQRKESAAALGDASG